MTRATVVWIVERSLSLRPPGGHFHHRLSPYTYPDRSRCGIDVDAMVAVRLDNADALGSQPCGKCWVRRGPA